MNPTKPAVNKILPMTSGHALERHRLFVQLGRDIPTKAFWISGPGGSGKTTLIASYLEKAKLPCLWYQIDAMDGDPATFFYYFGQAAASLLRPAEPPMPLLTPEYLPHMEVFVLRYFENLYQRLEPGFWLVFDNFQDAPEKSPLPQLLAAAVNQLPSPLRIAIISRGDPPPIMARFLANRILHPIGWSQLAFTADEFAAFLDHSGSRIAAGDAERLHQLTQGWIAGAILWLLQHSGDDMPSSLPGDQTPETIFDYFVVEILEKSTAETRHFLLQTALLPHMTADMADELTGMAAEKILESLYRQNFFLEKLRSPVASYQYHPLFRRFLLLRAERLFSSEVLRTLRCRAAAVLERQGRFEEAIDLYRLAGDLAAMQAILLAQARTLIDQGRYAALAAWFDYLPEDSVADHPWVLFWKGISRITDNPRESSRLCASAYELFARKGDSIGQIVCWSAAVEIPVMSGSSFLELDWWITEGDRLGRQYMSDAFEDADLAGRFSAGMLMALVMRDMGHPDLEGWQTRCESLIDRCRDQRTVATLMHNLFLSYHWLGQVHKSLIMETRLRLLLEAENLPPLGQIFTNAILMVACIIKGDYQEVHQLAEETLALAEETGIHLFDSLIMSHCTYNELAVGNLDQAPSLLAKLKETLTPFATWEHGMYHYQVSWYAMLTGDLVKAQNELDTAVRQVESCGNPFTIALCHVLQSQLFLEVGETEKAAELLARAYDEHRLGTSKLARFYFDLARADCALARDRLSEAHRYCRAAFASIRENALWIPFGLSRRRMADVHAMALAAGIEVETVVKMIRFWRLKPPDSERLSDSWPWPVRIATLGRFAMHRDDRPLALSAKTPKKPLELLTLLICAGQNGIFRETAAGKLWSDSDGDRAIRNLNTTLHRLRKLLGDDEVVIQQGGQLLVNREICWIDSWHFQRQAERIVSSPSHQTGATPGISRALTLYQGAFTTGHEHLGMVVGYSEQLHSLWLRVIAAALPFFAEMRGQSAQTIRQALTVDETAAAVFPLMVNGFVNRGEGPVAMATLGRCRHLLAKQGIMFGHRTTAYFRSLQERGSPLGRKSTSD